MRNSITEKIHIPEGVSCHYENNILTCKKNNAEVSKKIHIPGVAIAVKPNEIIFSCDKGSKNHRKYVMANIAHIKNLFHGIDEKFVYHLESCNVHFPISLKVEKNEVIITNFLGEKTPRKAKILPHVTVDIKGNLITVTSVNLESAGQTAANLEKATTIRNRDRRIFQDGIFITEKPGRDK